MNVSSTAAIAPVPGVSPYAASKAGVIALTKTAALELGPAGIRVNAVVPGGFDTAMNRNDREAYRSIPLGRIGAPRELAQTVAFLTSSAASYCTGATLVVDGGWTIGPPPPRPDFATPVKPTD